MDSIVSTGVAARPAAVRKVRLTWLIMLGLFVLACVPRGMASGSIITVDEVYHWFGRAEKFLAALRAGDYAATNLIGHPGVTTMWLGATGIRLHEWLTGLGWIDGSDPALRRALLRLPVAIVTALSVALAYPLLRRLLDRRIALLAALLWATDPFLIAHSQLLHTDALVTTFINLGLLAALLAFRIEEGRAGRNNPIRWPLLIASAVAGGLGLLTKSTAVLLPLLVGVIALLTGCTQRDPALRWTRRWPILPLLAWGVLAASVWFVLWPATWVDLPGALWAMYVQATQDGGTPHAWGNFFMGRAVADPGPLFYPVAVALRLTPWTLIGLLAAVGFALLRRRTLPHWPALGLLVLFVGLFTLALSIGPKKFDRYILPIFPALDVLAAAGLIWLIDALRRRWLRTHSSAPWAVRATWLGAVAVFAANVFWYHPYELAYYNQLLGGGAVAARTIPVGWGEGYEQVAAVIAADHSTCDRPIATWFGGVLVPQVCDPVVPLDAVTRPGEARYAVLYIDQMQRNDVPEATALLYGKQQPMQVIRIHGIDYAYIYQLTPPIANPVAANFGSQVAFKGYAVDTTALHTSGVLTATLQFVGEAGDAANRSLFIHLLDAQGNLVTRADVPLVGTYAPPSDWRNGEVVQWDQPLPTPAGLAPGTYWLSIGVYDATTFARLSLTGSAPADAPGDGPDALLLGPLTIQ